MRMSSPIRGSEAVSFARDDDALAGAVTKAQWRGQLKSVAFPPHLRFARYTLLSLADMMKTSGELARWQDDMVEKIGLPRRTLEFHLARSVTAGWLIHHRRGGLGRQAIYQASVPMLIRQPNSPQQVADHIMNGPQPVADLLSGLAATQYGQSPGSSPQSDCGVKTESASVSERVAVQSKINIEVKGEKQGRAEERVPAGAAIVAGSPSAERRGQTDEVDCARPGCDRRVLRSGPDLVYERAMFCAEHGGAR